MIFGVLASLLQVVVYYLLILILWNVGKTFHTPIKTDFSWWLMIKYSIYIFGIITVIQNLLVEILYKKKIIIYLFVLSVITFTLTIQNFPNYPLKTLILVISGLIALLIKLYFDFKFSKSEIK